MGLLNLLTKQSDRQFISFTVLFLGRSMKSEVEQKVNEADYAQWLVKLKQQLKNFKQEAKSDLARDQKESEKSGMVLASGSAKKTPKDVRQDKKKTNKKRERESALQHRIVLRIEAQNVFASTIPTCVCVCFQLSTSLCS